MLKKTYHATKLAAFIMLADRGGDRIYGYEMSRVSGLRSGVLYPIFARMEKAGWLSSAWENEAAPYQQNLGRPRRRYYWVTDLGRPELEKLAEAYKTLYKLDRPM